MTLRPDSDLTGHTLASRYDVLELLGAGGMGAVYRARDRELDELVALKVIRNELADVPAIVARFRQEVKLARRVTHTNVARTFELAHGDGVTFCTMELIEGESLTRRLAQRGSLPIGEAVAIVCALCEGLTAAHAVNVIHRDIKPDNVLIALDGRVVMADFGVAALRIAGDGDLSGTPAYMAPEQARGESPTPAADVYAVGVLLAEMVTGRRAFVGSAEKILAEKARVERVSVDIGFVPAELASVIGQATERDRDARIPTAAALRRALAPWSQPARAVTQPPPVERETTPIATVVVLAPSGVGPRLHLAEAVHEEVLARLAKMPLLRVLPRSERVTLPGAIEVAFELHEVLTVALVCHGAPRVELRLPLGVDEIPAAADAISAAVAAAVARTASFERDDRTSEATDLLLQARSLARHNQWYDSNAIALLERAGVLAPSDPRIAAGLAMGHVRMAFFRPDPDPHAIIRAAELARAAVLAAPGLADAQLAAGQVALEHGDSAAAAAHFRAAIACAPHSAEAHEALGRMLLEAGYLDAAIVRLEQAIAIAPSSASARWEIARAFMLEQKFDDYERTVAAISRSGDRPVVRARYAWWRRDRVQLAELRAKLDGKARMIVPGLLERAFAVYLDDAWDQHRAPLIAAAFAMAPTGRRSAFVRQLIAEAAGFAGDVATCNTLIESAIDAGMYDLHWLDRCPLLECVRPTTAFARTRAIVKQRADAILDALYGEHHVALSQTALASSV